MLNSCFNVLSKLNTYSHPHLIINLKGLRNLSVFFLKESAFTWRMYCTTDESDSPLNDKVNENIFVCEQDRYKGVIVNSEKNHCSDPDLFTSKLEQSIEKWKTHGVRGVWFNFSLENANWVPILAKNGFTFHHAEGDKVTMTRWLPEDEESGIPNYAHTMTGAGAIVVNSHNELLVVSEKYSLRNISHWKLPGGYIEKGETIADAAIREVFEETGVRAKFQSLVAVRHSQGSVFGCCDAYFIVELAPASENEQITINTREIKACRWMKIEEYINHPEVLDNNKKIAKNYLESKNACVRISGEKTFNQLMKRQQTLFMIDCSSKT